MKKSLYSSRNEFTASLSVQQLFHLIPVPATYNLASGWRTRTPACRSPNKCEVSREEVERTWCGSDVQYRACWIWMGAVGVRTLLVATLEVDLDPLKSRNRHSKGRSNSEKQPKAGNVV